MDMTKKCWNCYVRLPMDATECFSCGKKVGAPDARGVGEQPINWVGYILSFIGFAATAGFAYWLFFLKK